MIVDIDRTQHLRERRVLCAVLALASLGGVVGNLAEISWPSTVVLTVLSIVATIVMMGYSADLHAMKIADSDNRRRRMN